MEFQDVVRNRHSVRDFQEKKVDVKIIKRIIDAAMSAPSAGNLQAYKIHIVRSKESRESIAIGSDQHNLAKVPVILVFCADILKSEAKYHERGAELYSFQDATIACAYAQLAAANEGLSTVWVGGFEPLEIARIVGAVEYEVPCAMLAIGYPNAKPRMTDRRPMEEIVKEL
jgi:nitroreductase